MENLRRSAVTLTAHGGPEVLRLVDEDLPAPTEDQVTIAVRAVGVNYGDVLTRKGQYRPGAPLDVRPGLEVAGTVVRSAAPGLSAGQRVAAFLDEGGYASHVNAPAHRVFPLPDHLSFVDAAALLIQGTTALIAVRRIGRTGPGDWVLVHAAAGGVGSLAVQIAIADGARVVASASSPAKREFAAGLGATATVEPVAETLREQVREATGGAGVDVALDSVGGDLGSRTVGTLRIGGRMVVIGAASLEPTMVDARRLLQKSLTVSGFVLASVQSLDPDEPAEAFRQVVDLHAKGALRHAVTTMPLGDVALAHRALEQRSVTGKIVLEVDQ